MSEEFEDGVRKFTSYIVAETDADISATWNEFRVWRENHPRIFVDAQAEARRRWKATGAGS